MARLISFLWAPDIPSLGKETITPQQHGKKRKKSATVRPERFD